MENKYVIIETASITAQMKTDSVQGKAVRISSDVKPRGILKFATAKAVPESVGGYKVYSHAEILAEVEKPEWNTKDE